MKTLPWQPPQPPAWGLLLLAALGLAGLAWIESHPQVALGPHFGEKRAAAERTAFAFAALKEGRSRLGPLPSADFDPAESGLLGEPMSTVTGYPGSLVAKQTSLNPNFAAVLVEWLRAAGVDKGDPVAVGLSGSFPAVNVSALAALETIGAEPLVISSLGASQWGANRPDWLWLDQEAHLRAAGLLQTSSRAVSLGGVQDLGLGISAEGRELLVACAARRNVPLLTATDFTAGIDERMELYARWAGERPVKAYVNVGGNTLSVGTDEGKSQYPPGLSRGLPATGLRWDSVMLRFARQGVPVIHCVRIRDIAAKYGFPEAPTRMPTPGEGLVYARPVRDRTAAGLLLACLVLGIVLSKRLNCAVLLASRRRRAAAAERAEAAARRPESVVPKPHLGRLATTSRRRG